MKKDKYRHDYKSRANNVGNFRLTEKRVYETVAEIVGHDVVPVVKSIYGKKDVSEFMIAKKIKAEIHETRNMLYRLYSYNLAGYFKKKDREKGWYVGYWTFNTSRVKDLLIRLKEQKLNRLKTRLEQEVNESGSFYICSNACVRANFDQAAEFRFKCPECSTILVMQDNSKTIDNLKSRIKQLEVEA